MLHSGQLIINGTAHVEIAAQPPEPGGEDDWPAAPWPKEPIGPLRVFHFSDSHVSLETESWRQERVSLGLEPEDPMHEGHETERALRNFEQQVALAVERKADLIINTGDLLNLPSEETIAWVKNIIERAGIPFRFISGNHDWCFEGLGKPPRYCWHLGCILPRVPAMIVVDR